MACPRLHIVAGGSQAVASVRHRLVNYLDFLSADGVAVTWAEYRGDQAFGTVSRLLERARFLARLAAMPGRPDTILVQKVLVPSGLVRLWRRRGARVVYDFDDALFAPSCPREPVSVTRRRSARLSRLLASVDAVIAGSPPLAAYARAHSSAQTFVLYPSLARSRFEQIRGRGSGPNGSGSESGAEVRLGWIGGASSHRYLIEFEPVLATALERWPQAHLHVCTSAMPPFRVLPRERVHLIPWSVEAEVVAAGSFDIALSPMGSDPWSRARGGRVSVLISMAAATPVIAGRGGGLDELVAGDGNGIWFPETADEWLGRLDTLIGDARERRRTGEKARAVIDSQIWADVQYPEFKKAVFPEQ